MVIMTPPPQAIFPLQKAFLSLMFKQKGLDCAFIPG
jgi:hypothetical protein